MPQKRWRVVGIDFDHMHMGDNLSMAKEHPQVDIVGICDADPARMANAIDAFSLSDDQVFTDFRECLGKTKPDFVILCPATARHGEYVEAIAPYGPHLLVEKPFAATLAEADRMMAAIQPNQRLAINWPLAWYPV
ncbi:MAG: Gfo/Idh/MocA family oxidoreductase, partial [Candidatus Hydrogenedentales bacterium]